MVRIDGDHSLFRPIRPGRIRDIGRNDGQDPDERFLRTLEESSLLQQIRNREPDIRRYRDQHPFIAGVFGSGAQNAGAGEPGRNGSLEDIVLLHAAQRKEQTAHTMAYELQRHPSLPDQPGERLDISA